MPSEQAPTNEQMSEALDIIHDLALKAMGTPKLPREVDEALDEIVALARYKFNVLRVTRTKSILGQTLRIPRYDDDLSLVRSLRKSLDCPRRDAADCNVAC